MPPGPPAPQSWVTPETLDLIGTELLLLAPTLGARLEDRLFDPVEDAHVERTLTELARRVGGWDLEDSASALSVVVLIDDRIMGTMRSRYVDRIATCTALFEMLSGWVYVAARGIENSTPAEVHGVTSFAGYGAELAARIAMKGAQLVGLAADVVRLERHLPARAKIDERTVH